MDSMDLTTRINQEEQAIRAYFSTEQQAHKFKQTLLDYVQANSTSLKNPQSVIESAKTIAKLDLHLGGDVDIVPRQGKCKAELNYKGYITLVTRSGVPASANVVYSADEFDIDIGAGTIKHIPGEDRANSDVVGYYAKVRIAGEQIVDFMSAKEMENFKKEYVPEKSRMGNTSPWRKAPTEMGKKTVLKRLLKPYLYVFKDLQLIEGNDIDNEATAPEPEDSRPVLSLENASSLNKAIARVRDDGYSRQDLEKIAKIPDDVWEVIQQEANQE